MIASLFASVGLGLTYLKFVGMIDVTYLQCWTLLYIYLTYKIFLFILEVIFGARKF